jgi:hypothetical protein
MKQFFSIVMVLALVIVAGTAMAQTSVTPYAGSKYSYTVGGIDAGGSTRKARIYYTTDASPTTQIQIGDAASISFGTTTTEPGAAANATGVAAGNAWDITLPVGATSLTFEATYGTGVALAASRIWIEVYNDAAGIACNNTMFLNVTPVVNTLDFSITAAVLTQCPTFTIPTAQQTDAINNTTNIVYTVARIDGNNSYDWSFKLAMLPLTFGPTSENVTVAYTVGAGSVVSGSGYGADILIRGTNSVTVTITVTNKPGEADQNFVGTLSSMTQYVNQTSVVNSTHDDSANNIATTTLKEVPSIGTFIGN